MLGAQLERSVADAAVTTEGGEKTVSKEQEEGGRRALRALARPAGRPEGLRAEPVLRAATRGRCAGAAGSLRFS